jgi:hypothetical protein
LFKNDAKKIVCLNCRPDETSVEALSIFCQSWSQEFHHVSCRKFEHIFHQLFWYQKALWAKEWDTSNLDRFFSKTFQTVFRMLRQFHTIYNDKKKTSQSRKLSTIENFIRWFGERDVKSLCVSISMFRQIKLSFWRVSSRSEEKIYKSFKYWTEIKMRMQQRPSVV